MSRLRNYQVLEFDTASLSASFQNFGSVTTDEVVEMVLVNDSDVHVYVTIDGTNNDIRVPDGATVRFSSQTPTNQKFLAGKGVQFKVKQVTGTGTGHIVANLLLEG